MSSNKSKQNRLNLKQKVDILNKIDKGVQLNRIAADYGVSKQAISKIKKKRNEILKVITNSFENSNKKTLHKSEYPELEDKVFEWFFKQRERNCTINGQIIKEKALSEFQRMYPDKEINSFNASNGWLQKFRKRYGIRSIKVCGEILSNETSEITPFIHKLRSIINEMELTSNQMYNADESGLYYRLLPDKTFVHACEKTAPGRKVPKERITIMLCANADGSHKLNPMVIGKSANPRCFKNFKNPLHYASSPSAWMTSKIFYEWFHNSFVKEVCIYFEFIKKSFF